MAFNGSGVFVRLYTWATDKTNSVPVTASRMDSEMDGMATGLSTCIAKDGQTATTARIPFASGTSAAAGSTAAASYGQTNDADTGMYFPNTNEVALVAGGQQAITFTATVGTVPAAITLKSNTTPYDAFPSATAILFQQTAAPTGWTKSTTHNDKAIRVVSGTASSGGTSAFSTVFSKTVTDAVTLVTGNLPAHNHTITATGDDTPDHSHTVTVATNNIGYATGANALGVFGAGSGTTFATGGASVRHAHPATTNNTGSGTSFTAGMDIRVQYMDVIVATKN